MYLPISLMHDPLFLVLAQLLSDNMALTDSAIKDFNSIKVIFILISHDSTGINMNLSGLNPFD